jgi:hypothetical protein
LTYIQFAPVTSQSALPCAHDCRPGSKNRPSDRSMSTSVRAFSNASDA